MPEDQKPDLPPVTVQLQKRIDDLEAKLDVVKGDPERKRLIERIDALEKELADSKKKTAPTPADPPPPPAKRPLLPWW